MPQAIVKVDRLVVHVTDFRRVDSPALETETLEVDLTVENAVGSPHQARRIPAMEVRDESGAPYAVIQDDALVEPLLPNQTVDGRPRFLIPADALDLRLVLAPGTDEEAVVGLVGG